MKVTELNSQWLRQEHACDVQFVFYKDAQRVMKSWVTTKQLKEFIERSKTMRQWNLQFEEVQSVHVAALVNAKW